MITVKCKDLNGQLNLISFHSAIGTLVSYEVNEIGIDEYNRPINEYLVTVDWRKAK